MKLHNGHRAFVDISKLTDYCLSPVHPKGRHKARVFASVLGLDAGHAEFLRSALLEAARDAEAVPADHDEYGRRYVVDFLLVGPSGRGTVRSTWIVRAAEDFPRLTSCWVL
jgi:hypothetical protein